MTWTRSPTQALRCGAEIVVHAYRGRPRARACTGSRSSGSTPCSARRPAPARISRCCSPTSKGASLIVAVGTHCTLVEFLDKGRSGMASTFLTRLGSATRSSTPRGVSRLYRSRISDAGPARCSCSPPPVTCPGRRGLPAGPILFRFFGPSWRLLLLADRTFLVIDFRYHLVSIVAVFLALAVGIVIGATALNGAR